MVHRRRHRGPSDDLIIVPSLKFKQKWKKVRVLKGRVYTTIERKHYDPLSFSKHLIKEPWFKEKVKSVKVYLQD